MPIQPQGIELLLAKPEDLLSRLLHLLREQRPVVFLVGAPVSGSPDGTSPGVPMVSGMVDMVRAQYEHHPSDLTDLNERLATATNLYQAAFEHLIRRRGPDLANQVVRDAVLRAHVDAPGTPLPPRLGPQLDQRCAELESHVDRWHLPPACKALGQLAARFPSVFGARILTTNFDPLLQIAVHVAGGKTARTVLDQDGHCAPTDADACHIVHLHGHWSRSDTLHTSLQLNKPRPRLRRSLETLIADYTVVTLACGGWDDVFNSALTEVLSDGERRPDVLWTFRETDPAALQTRQARLLEKLTPGIHSSRVNLYGGIDVHTFLPLLLEHCGFPSTGTASTRTAVPLASHQVVAAAAVPRTPSVLSPFRDRGRIIDPGQFFDREEIMSNIFHELHKGGNVSLVGSSSIGKSSILSMLCHLGPSKINMQPSDFIYIDLQLIDKEDDFYKALCNKLDIPFCKGGALAEKIAGRSLVLCIDEIEKMHRTGRRAGFGRPVRTHLRGLADGTDRPLRLVIASRQPLNELFQDDESGSTSPLHNICLSLPLRGFDLETTRRFLRSRLEPTGVTFSEHQEDLLFTQSEGHPGNLQELAHKLFEHKTGRQ